MTDIAQLGIQVDSSPASRAAVDLDKLAASAKTADAATSDLAGSARTMAAAATVEDAAVVRLTATQRIQTQVSEAEAVAARIATSAHLAHGNAVGLNSMQVAELGHVTRSLFGSMSAGIPITRALGFELNRIVSIFTIGQGGVLGTFRALGGVLAPLAPVLLGIAAAAGGVVAIFAGMTTKINETAKTQVNFGEVFRATIQVIAGDIGKFFKPAVDKLGGWWQQFVDWITPTFKMVGNTIINVFSTAFNIVKDTWSLLPDAFASIFTKAMNGAIDIVQNGINGIIGPINDLLAKVNLPGIGKADLSGFKGKPSNADTKLGLVISRDAAAGMSADPLGQFFGQVSQQAQVLALSDAADKASKSMKAANDNAKLLRQGLKDVGGEADLVAKNHLAMVETALGAFGQLTGGLSQLFQNNKALAIANAVVNTAEGITKALAQGGVFGYIAAAGVAASGAAQIATIASASPGSSTTPTVDSGSAAAATAPAATPGTAINLTIRGSGAVDVDTLADQLAKSIADGGNQALVKVLRAA